MVSDDLLHFELLKRSGNAILSHVVRGAFLGEVVEHMLRQRCCQILQYVAALVGVGAGLAALWRHAPASVCAGNVVRQIQMPELSAKKGSRGARGGKGAICKELVGVRLVERELGLENLGARISLRALVGGCSHNVHPRPDANDELGNRFAVRRRGRSFSGPREKL